MSKTTKCDACLSIRRPQEWYAQLEAIARARDLKVSELTRLLIEQAIAMEGGLPPPARVTAQVGGAADLMTRGPGLRAWLWRECR